MEAAISLHAVDPDPSWAGEERLVREAVLLVASGMSPRVLVAGLAHGDVVRDRCKSFALESGTRLRALPTSRVDRSDILVETIAR